MKNISFPTFKYEERSSFIDDLFDLTLKENIEETRNKDTFEDNSEISDEKEDDTLWKDRTYPKSIQSDDTLFNCSSEIFGPIEPLSPSISTEVNHITPIEKSMSQSVNEHYEEDKEGWMLDDSDDSLDILLPPLNPAPTFTFPQQQCSNDKIDDENDDATRESRGVFEFEYEEHEEAKKKISPSISTEVNHITPIGKSMSQSANEHYGEDKEGWVLDDSDDSLDILLPPLNPVPTITFPQQQCSNDANSKSYY